MGRKNSEHKNIIRKNVKSAFLILLAGFVLTILLIAKDKNTQEVNDFLIRDEDGKTKNIKLIAQSDLGEKQIDIDVLPRTYSTEEIESFKAGFLKEIKTLILSDNQNFNSINRSLYFPERIEDYPFDIDYRVRPRGYISSSGELMGDVEEATDIEIEITYYLDDFEEKEYIEGTIIPLEKAMMNCFSRSLKNILKIKTKTRETIKT